MKRLIISLLTLLSLVGLQARDYGDEAKFGIKLAWDLNMPTTSLNDIVSTYHTGSGVSASAFYNMPVYRHLYIEAGAGFYYNTMIVSQNISEDIQLDYPLTPEGSIRNGGFRIPVTLGYMWEIGDGMKLSVFTGPQLNVGLWLQQYENLEKTHVDLYDKGWHRLDLQWTLGVRFYYADNWMAEISGGAGLTNMMGGEQYKGEHFRRNTFMVGVGYLF